MKKLIVATVLASITYGSCGDLVQKSNLTSYRRYIGDYCSDQTQESGEYILVRDHRTPEKVRVRIIRNTGKTKKTNVPYYGRNEWTGKLHFENTVVTTEIKQNKTLELDFSNSVELTEGEREELRIKLDFSKDRIKIEGFEIDSPYSYKLNKDTWWLDQSLDMRLKVIKE